VKRVKIGLSLLAAASALALTLAPSASAAPASAPAAKPGQALVPTSAQPPTVRSSAAGIDTGASTNADQDGACNSNTNGTGDVCLWFSTNFVGSLSDSFTSKTNLNNLRFLTPGLGLGDVVANNSESALNADTRLSVVVWTGVSFSGTPGVLQPRAFGNFNPTFVNNVESFQFQ
jgi:Peptidase inhibitor family I36